MYNNIERAHIQYLYANECLRTVHQRNTHEKMNKKQKNKKLTKFLFCSKMRREAKETTTTTTKFTTVFLAIELPAQAKLQF